MLLIVNGLIICPDRILGNGAVYIENGLVKEVGRSGELEKKYPSAKTVDAQGGLVMPGLTNAHMHLYSTFARGMSLPGKPPKNFVEILDNLWWRLDKALTEEDIYYSALVPLMECVRCGTTTIIDHHASPGFVKGSLEKIGEALEMIPIRASLCYEVSDRDGPEVSAAGIEENVRFVKEHAGNEILNGMFGLHASMTLSDGTLKKCVDAANGLGCGFHVHTAEDKADLDDCLDKYGMGVVERWGHHGLLGPKTILAHCVHISEAEMEFLAESGTTVVHNPESNMNNAVGSADVLGMLSRGATVGLGTDGMTADMFKEAKFAHLIRKHVEGDPRVGFTETGKMLFENNSKILSDHFGVPVGKIEVGATADIIILDYDPPSPLTAENFLGHFLYGMSSRDVVTTIVNGKVLMENRELVGIDEEKSLVKSRERAGKLWRRI